MMSQFISGKSCIYSIKMNTVVQITLADESGAPPEGTQTELPLYFSSNYTETIPADYKLTLYDWIFADVGDFKGIPSYAIDINLECSE